MEQVSFTDGNNIGINAIKHFTRSEVVRQIQNIGTYLQADPKISNVWRKMVDNNKSGFCIFEDKLRDSQWKLLLPVSILIWECLMYLGH